MELFFVHEFAWSNRASTNIDDGSKTQIISKYLHHSFSFKNKEYISRVFKGCLANFTIKI